MIVPDWKDVYGTDLDSRACQSVLQSHISLITFLDLSATGLISTSAGGDMFSWSLDDYAEKWKVNAHDNSVTTLQRSESILVTGGSDGKVKVWNGRWRLS